MNEKLYKQVYEILEGSPKIDIHTHLTANRLMARGLDDILLYHMVNSELYSSGCSQGERVPEEWAFFARTQWGQPDIPLFELERVWNAREPQKPVPVTLKAESRPQFAKKIKTVEDIKRAVSRYCSLIPYADVRATAQHFSTDIDYGDYSQDRVQKALDNRGSAGTEEQNIYSSVIMQMFLQELEKHGKEIVFQFSLGAEALPFESGMRLRQQTLAQLGDLIYRYPNLHFMCFNASRHCNQSLCTLVRELQNFSLAGFWWHSFFPGAMKQIAEERLDMIPLNRQVGYLTDAYCMDWVYGKNRIILSQYAIVFTEKIQTGQYTVRDVEYIAKSLFYDSPIELLSITI